MDRIAITSSTLASVGYDAKQRVRASYGDNYARLVTLKRKYDPTNLFRRNANIDPGA